MGLCVYKITITGCLVLASLEGLCEIVGLVGVRSAIFRCK